MPSRRRKAASIVIALALGAALILALTVASPGGGGVSAVATCNTTLAQAASAGDDTILVANQTGCDIGDTIVLNQGGGTEECQEIEQVGAVAPSLDLVGMLAHSHNQGETVVEVAVCPTPPPTETPTPTPTPSPTATPTATATPTPVAQVLNCPQAGKWSIAVWDAGADGADTDGDGTDTGEALGTCGEGVVDAAYFLDPDSQMWRRWFPGHPEISNFESVRHDQGFIAHGSPLAVQRIAFTSDRDGNYEIYVMDTDGSDQTRLTNNPAEDNHPAWSPDRSKIAFVSKRDGNYEIYVMNADGTGQTNLTNNPAWDGNPAWSPDGTKIAFDSYLAPGNRDIYVMNADGTGQTRLTHDPMYADHPTWSPDGSKIAFMSDRDWDFEIYVMNADGSGQTNLTNSRGRDELPAWSPDGTKIAFDSDPDLDGNSEIYVMNADGTAQTRLTETWTIGWNARVWKSAWAPTWSPDGSKIAFASDLYGDYEIYAGNAEGTYWTNTTNNLTNNPDHQDESPAWAAPMPRFTVTPGLGARQVLNCPQAGKWSIAVADFPEGVDGDGVDMGEALATCEQEVDAAYFLDPDSQMWLRWFPGHPEISNFGRVKHKQGFIAHASLVASLVARRD
jgi:Tol biopolymer transport system component